MPPRSNVPIRIGGSKTRTGCRTCKQRHVKCDERRPTCLRCQKVDRQCSYDAPQTASPNCSLVPAVGNATNCTNMTLSWGISPLGSHGLKEAAAVENFTLHLGKELSGCFSNEVWCHVFPQVAQHESTIWHAIAAVGMLDRSLRLGHDLNDGSPEVDSAVRQYSKAIQGLYRQLACKNKADCKDVILLSCILFAIFECLQNHLQSALQHISSGMKLLMEWRREARSQGQDDTGTYLDHNLLRPIFLSLDSQAVQMGVVDFQDYHSLRAMTEDVHIPALFTTIQEAHVALNSIFNRMSRWTGAIRPDVIRGAKLEDRWMNSEESVLRSLLADWQTAFQAPLDLFHSQPATLLLVVQKQIMQIIFDKEVNGPSEMSWDEYVQDFEKATRYAEVYMSLTMTNHQLRSQSDESPPQNIRPRKPVLTVTMDIVLSLYLICVKCRSSQLRQRALTMLKTCRRKEGVWDSDMCSVVADKIIELEECGASVDGLIPESARVHTLNVRFDENQVARITHNKLVPNGDGTYHVETFHSG